MPDGQTTGASALLHAYAGQFCTIRVPEISLTRAYSLSRAPQAEQDKEHSFIIRLLPGGAFSEWLTAASRVGRIVELSGPLGNFMLDSGMSAMFAVIEQAQLIQRATDCHFFYGARTSADLYKQAEITQIKQGWHPAYQFEYMPVLSNEPDGTNWSGNGGLVGDIAVKTLRSTEQFPMNKAIYYLCGPPQLVASVVANLTELGVPRENFRFDKFEDAHGPAPSIDNSRCVLCDECLLVKPNPNCIVESTQLDSASGPPSRIVPLHTSGLYYNSLVIDPLQCIRCHACINACPHGAISINKE